MKKFFISLIIGITSIVQAEIIVGTAQGGWTGSTAEEIVRSLKTVNINETITYTNNCQLGALVYKQGNEQLFLVSHSTTVLPSSCALKINLENFVDIVLRHGQAVCHQKSKTDLNLQHFLNVDKKKIFAITFSFKPQTLTWIQDLKLDNSIRLIQYSNHSMVKAASFTNEADYFLLDTGTALAEKNRLSCIFITTEYNVPGLSSPTLESLKLGVRLPVVYNIQLAVNSGTKKTEEYRKLIYKAKQTEAWRNSINNLPGVESIDMTPEHGYNFYKKQIEFLQ